MAISDPEHSTSDRIAQTEEARRASRYKFARLRVRKIVDGSPELTDEQLADLAAIIQGGAGR